MATFFLILFFVIVIALYIFFSYQSQRIIIETEILEKQRLLDHQEETGHSDTSLVVLNAYPTSIVCTKCNTCGVLFFTHSSINLHSNSPHDF